MRNERHKKKAKYRQNSTGRLKKKGNKLTDHGRPTSNSSSGAVVEIIDSHSSHEWQLHVSMGINTTLIDHNVNYY